MDTMTPHPSGQGKIVSARAAVSRIRKGSTVATQMRAMGSGSTGTT